MPPVLPATVAEPNRRRRAPYDQAVAGTANWKQQPDAHDYPAAESYLSLVVSPTVAARIVKRLRKAPIEHFKAKDILRASRLALLDTENAHVAHDLDKVGKGEQLSPVLLVRGDLTAGVPLTIADGYHRVCASYHLDENTEIPCRVVSPPGRTERS